MKIEFEPLEKVLIKWAVGADGSLNIRKWSQFPFDGAIEYAASSVLTRERDEAIASVDYYKLEMEGVYTAKRGLQSLLGAFEPRWKYIEASIRDLIRERDEAREALTWQPMSSAPLDREILLDVSYWYPGDTSVTACYFIGSWASNMWDCGEELRRSDQINAWMDIPTTTLPRPAPEHLAGGSPE